MLPEWIVRMVEVPELQQHAPSDCAVTDGFLGAAFREAGWLGRDLGGGKAAARCPWEDEHTSGSRYDSSTVVFAPRSRQAHWAFSLLTLALPGTHAARCARRAPRRREAQGP